MVQQRDLHALQHGHHLRLSDGTFRPDAPITRAELTKIAAGFFSDPRVAATYDGRFSDVHGAEWYISYLMTALEEGLIEGYPDGSFRPNRPITRAETCTIVNRTLGRKPEKDHLLPESDMINWPDNINRNIWYYAQMQEATNSHDYRWTSSTARSASSGPPSWQSATGPRSSAHGPMPTPPPAAKSCSK